MVLARAQPPAAIAAGNAKAASKKQIDRGRQRNCRPRLLIRDFQLQHIGMGVVAAAVQIPSGWRGPVPYQVGIIIALPVPHRLRP